MKKLIVFLLVYPAVALLALRVGAVLTDMSTVGSFFRGVDPLLVVVTIAAGFAIASYLLGALTSDYSWVDRLWSTAPVAFAWVYAVRSNLAAGVTFGVVLVTVWGLRLTYNFARRGGYTTMEDYRWPILRDRIGSPLLWQLFNLLFISGFQILLFVLFTLPIYRLMMHGGDASLATVGVASLFFLGFLAYETIADQQQWTFQNLKHGERRPVPAWFGGNEAERERAFEADLERGFLTHGLFRFSRHPNYFGELAVWWVLYFYSCGVTGTWVHWSGVGALLLTLLFVGSTAFTESISAARYPRYTDYQAMTSAIVPWPAAPPAAREQVE